MSPNPCQEGSRGKTKAIVSGVKKDRGLYCLRESGVQMRYLGLDCQSGSPEPDSDTAVWGRVGSL